MVKPIKMVEKVDTPDKKNCFKITLGFEARYQAFESLLRRGLKTEEDRDTFEGPDFKDIKGYSLNGPWVVVMTQDDAQYVYPAESIARIKTYSE